MKIKSSNDFINLFIITLAKEGYIISTYNFNKELLEFLTDRKYANLFSFFQELSDFNFNNILNLMEEEGLIELTPREDDNITIKICNKFLYPIAERLLSEYDESLYLNMKDLIKDINLTQKFQGKLPKGATGTYKRGNPNNLYTISSDSRIITDGDLEELTDNKFLVQNASFTITETIKEDKVIRMDIILPFENDRYMDSVIDQVLNYDKEPIYHFETNDYKRNFKEKKQGTAYQYHRHFI